MKAHTSKFKENIKKMGRELDSKITYILGDEKIELGADELNSITPSYQGALLKSVMKQLDIDSNVIIPVGTILNYQFGVKIDGEYEYINFGNYVVKDIEKQEDTNSYKITCYDKLLFSMIDYVNLDITFPITIRDYINYLCGVLSIEFANKNDVFANYDKELTKEVYLDENGENIGYTFRDIFDELAQATASTICINNDDKLEIRYIKETNDTIDEEYFKDINVNFGEKYGKINSIVLSRSGESDNVYLRDEQSVEQNGLCELKIVDNQIMNDNNRSDYLPNILEKLNGIEYYINDYSSTGICYYDLCDRYNVLIGDNVYSCVMFNDEIIITQGLEENIYTEMPEESETDYNKADKTDRRINQAYIIVNKQNQSIEALTSSVSQVEIKTNNNYQATLEKFDNYTPLSKTIQIENSVKNIQTDTYTKTEINTKLIDGSVSKVQTTSGTFDENGMTYEKTNAPTSTTINEVGVRVNKINSTESVLFAGYVNDENQQYSDYAGQTIVASENIIVRNYLVVGSKSRLEDYEDGTGIFV